MRSLRSLGVVLSLGALAGFAMVIADAHSASAVGTRTFDLDTADKLAGGEQKGTAITSLGQVQAGWSTSRTSIMKATTIWSALAMPDGAVLLGGSPEGRVLKIDATGNESIVADTGAMDVGAMVVGPGGKIYAGTSPKGEIFIIDPTQSFGINASAAAPPKLKAWVTLPSDHIWALAYDGKRNELFAGTGPDGKIYRIDAAGKFQVFHTVDDTQVTSLAFSPSGTLYAGTSAKGLLLAISAPGKAEVVQDFNGHEVKAIAFVTAPAKPKVAAAASATTTATATATATTTTSSGDTVFAIVNEYPSPPDPAKKSGPSTKQGGAASEAPKLVKGKSELWKVSGLAADGTGGKPEKMWSNDATTLFALALDSAGNASGAIAYVGTAADGRVIAIDEAHVTSTVAKVDERLIGAIGVTPGGKGSWFAAGDSAAFHRVTGVGGADATWTSKALDAGLKAHFGKLSWLSSGPIELETRSGSTATTDDSWSAWSAPLAAPGKVTSPAARFVQIRARWKGAPTATLQSVTLAFVTDNLRAIVTEVTVPSKPALPSGVPSSGSDVPTKSSSLKLTWKVDNPDADSLRYRLWFRKEDSATWRPITKEDEPLSAQEYSWGTEALAEGWYRVRVEASDEMANPIGSALKHALDSAPFVVDNTPPTITKLVLAGGKLQADVVDGVGPIARLEVQIDGKPPWRPVASIDGILDDAKESVDTALGLTGSHVVALRAYDAAGNAVTKEIEGK